jgi:hypothetical protein
VDDIVDDVIARIPTDGNWVFGDSFPVTFYKEINLDEYAKLTDL